MSPPLLKILGMSLSATMLDRLQKQTFLRLRKADRYYKEKEPKAIAEECYFFDGEVCSACCQVVRVDFYSKQAP